MIMCFMCDCDAQSTVQLRVCHTQVHFVTEHLQLLMPQDKCASETRLARKDGESSNYFLCNCIAVIASVCLIQRSERSLKHSGSVNLVQKRTAAACVKEIFGEIHISLFSVQKINYFHAIQRTLGFLSLDFELYECVLFFFFKWSITKLCKCHRSLLQFNSTVTAAPKLVLCGKVILTTFFVLYFQIKYCDVPSSLVQVTLLDSSAFISRFFLFCILFESVRTRWCQKWGRVGLKDHSQ